MFNSNYTGLPLRITDINTKEDTTEETTDETIKEKDVVRGEVHRNFCTSQRFTDYGCGPDAKYFEQYEPPVPEPPWWTQNLEKLKNLLG